MSGAFQDPQDSFSKASGPSIDDFITLGEIKEAIESSSCIIGELRLIEGIAQLRSIREVLENEWPSNSENQREDYLLETLDEALDDLEKGEAIFARLKDNSQMCGEFLEQSTRALESIAKENSSTMAFGMLVEARFQDAIESRRKILSEINWETDDRGLAYLSDGWDVLIGASVDFFTRLSASPQKRLIESGAITKKEAEKSFEKEEAVRQQLLEFANKLHDMWEAAQLHLKMSAHDISAAKLKMEIIEGYVELAKQTVRRLE